jgi:hypothetical protein
VEIGIAYCISLIVAFHRPEINRMFSPSVYENVNSSRGWTGVALQQPPHLNVRIHVCDDCQLVHPGEVLKMTVPANTSVAELKRELELLAGVAARWQRLVFAGRKLADDETVGETIGFYRWDERVAFLVPLPGWQR